MATRNTKTQTATAAEQVVPPVAPDAENSSFYNTVREYAAAMGVTLPTGRLLLAGTVAQIVVSALGSISAIQFSGYIALGVLMLSGSSFLSMLIAILVAVAGIVAALYAGSKVGVYVCSGGVERDLGRAKNFITGFFKKVEAPKAA